jgi:uncharacterized protein with FMN-binding domain
MIFINQKRKERKMFKKVKFELSDGNFVDTYEGENKSLADVIAILSDPNIISLTVTKMTKSEYFKKNNKIKGVSK